MKSYQEPTVERRENDPTTAEVERHPAYATMTINRVSGRSVLYGSDFEHQSFVRLRVYPAETHRTLSEDRVFPLGRPILEVNMTEAQWATYVSAFSVGEGVPCTLGYVRDVGDVPGIMAPKDRAQQFTAEVDQRIAQIRTDLAELQTLIADAPMSKKAKQPLLDKLYRVSMDLNDGLPFIGQQFGRFMEKTVERAKVEVYSWTQQLVTRLGRRALEEASTDGPLALPPNDDREQV